MIKDTQLSFILLWTENTWQTTFHPVEYLVWKTEVGL